jgi:hypothetical protein
VAGGLAFNLPAWLQSANRGNVTGARGSMDIYAGEWWDIGVVICAMTSGGQDRHARLHDGRQ